MKITLDLRMVNMSGIGRYTRGMLPALLAKKEHFYYLMGDEAELKPYLAKNTKIISATSGIYDPRSHFEFKKKAPQCDIFFSPHFVMPVFKLPSKRNIITIHDVLHISDVSPLNFAEKKYMRFLYKTAVRRADDIITVSEFSKTEILRFLPSKKNITVIPNFVDTTQFYHSDKNEIQSVKSTIKQNTGFDFTQDFCLYVGNIKTHKNLIRLLEAFSKTEDKNLTLMIVGNKEGFLRKDTHFDDTFARTNNVIFTGKINDTELRGLYSLAKFFVMPSFYEGFGLPPLEAMACGTPVVASNIGAVREVCDAAALYFDPFSIDDIASKLNTINHDKSLRTKLIKDSRKRVELFSKTNTIEKHLKLFFG